MIFSILIMLVFFLTPLFYMRVIKEKKWGEIKKELFPKIENYKKEIKGATALLLLLLIFSFSLNIGIGIIEGYSGEKINDLEKVGESIDRDISENWTIFIIFIVIGVFIEEFFFRSFLVPRTGIVLSTLIFTLAHIGYGSIIELIGVIVLGGILAIWFKKNQSLLQNYLGHIAYNIIAILLYLAI